MSLQVFLVAFLVSYAGSIPPGTINISVMQLSMQQQRRAAIYLALSASMVEFVYAGVAVQFQQLLSGNETLNFYFMIITGAVLIVMGIYNLFSNTRSDRFLVQGSIRRRVGFARGFMLGVLNPLTIPFWLAVTAYLESQGWILLNGHNFWVYIGGLSIGTFVLLVCVDILGNRYRQIADNVLLVHRVPGLLLMGMGIYNIWTIFQS